MSGAAFVLNPDARVLTAPTNDIDALCQGLRLGHSIAVSAHGTHPLSTRPESDGPYLYCATSGSTGKAKIIRRRPASWIASFRINRDRFGAGPHHVYATLGPLTHSLALYAALEALHLGAALASLDGLSRKAQLGALEHHRVSLLYATPTQLRLLVKAADSGGGVALPDMKHIFCGGGPLDEGLRTDLAQLCPEARIRAFYGTAETSFITIAHAFAPDASVGAAYPGVEIEIRACDTAGIGEIWVASPYLFDAYEGTPDSPALQDGQFVATGELGRLDAAGQLFLRGRLDRRVTIADQNVYPEAVEAALLQAGLTAPCVVLARPDAERGHRLVVCVEGVADGRVEQLIRQTCHAVTGPHTVPKDVVFIEVIPTLPMGKPDLQRLSAMLEARV